jgi:hypothetical protein
MSARKLETDIWEIELAFPGKTRKHWRKVATVLGSHPEAEAKGVELYLSPEYRDAKDVLVVPAEVDL